MSDRWTDTQAFRDALDAHIQREPDGASDEEAPAPHAYRPDCGCPDCLETTDQMGDDE